MKNIELIAGNVWQQRHAEDRGMFKSGLQFNLIIECDLFGLISFLVI